LGVRVRCREVLPRPLVPPAPARAIGLLGRPFTRPAAGLQHRLLDRRLERRIDARRVRTRPAAGIPPGELPVGIPAHRAILGHAAASTRPSLTAGLGPRPSARASPE